MKSWFSDFQRFSAILVVLREIFEETAFWDLWCELGNLPFRLRDVNYEYVPRLELDFSKIDAPIVSSNFILIEILLKSPKIAENR